MIDYSFVTSAEIEKNIMRIIRNYLIVVLLTPLFLVSCLNGKTSQQDIVISTFEEEEQELRGVISMIVRDAETANLEGLKNIHLDSDKFTKFGPRNFERQDVDKTNDSELAFFGTASSYKEKVEDLKIDVFGEVGIVTYYRVVSFEQDGEEQNVNLRQPLF